MKTLALTSALLLFNSLSFASEWSFDYLNKLYQKDQEKCYDRCQMLMNIFQKQESPYYFAMKIQANEAISEQKIKSKNARIIKAIEYARYFEEYASTDLKRQLQWDTIEPYLHAIASDIRISLDDENLNSNIKQLDDKWKKYTGNSLKSKKAQVELSNTKVTETKNNENVAITTNISFNGMPSGLENLSPVDLKREKELLILINKERKKQKMDTLIWDADLTRAARYHATDMGTQDYFDHDSHDRKQDKLVEIGDTFDRIKKFYTKSFVNSENIAAGNATAAETYQQWFNSPGHYENMFNKSSKFVGIAMAQVPGSSWEYYWVFCTAM